MYNIEELKSASLKVVTKNNLPAITNQADFATAGDILKILKNQRATIEDERKTYTDPLLKTQKKIKADFDRADEPIDNAIETIDRMMKSFWTEEKKRVDALQLEMDNKAGETAGAAGILVPIVNNIKSLRGDIASTTVKTITRFRLLDLNLVPKAFLCLDEKALKAHIEDGKSCPPGIEYYEELSISSR